MNGNAATWLARRKRRRRIMLLLEDFVHLSADDKQVELLRSLPALIPIKENLQQVSA